MDVVERWKNDGKGYKTQYFYRAINKYGWNNIIHEIVCSGVSKDVAETKEKELIALYKSNNAKFGYNIDNGGKTGGRMSESTKEKLRKINTGKRMSEETKKKISLSETGRKLTEEHKRKIGDWHRGKHISDEQKERLREIHTGTHLSDETKAKISAIHKGEKHHNATKICLLDEQGKIIKEYNTIMQASEELSVSRNSITAVLKGRQKSTKGLHFSYSGELQDMQQSEMTLQDIDIKPKIKSPSITYRGETHTRAEWAKIKGINPSTLKVRLERGFSADKALGETQSNR